MLPSDKLNYKDLLSKYLTYLLLALPIIIMILGINFIDKNIPHADEIYFIQYIEKFYQGKLTFFDLWRNIADHREYFYKTLFVLSGVFLNLNVQIFNYISVILCTLYAIIIYRQFKKSLTCEDINKSLLLFSPVLFLLFSLRQHHSFFWGECVQHFIFILLGITSFIFFQKSDKNRYFDKNLFWAITSGGLSALLYDLGYCIYPTIFLSLFIEKINKKSVFKVLLFCLIGVLVFFTVFSGFDHTNTDKTSKITSFDFKTLTYASGFFFINIGSSLLGAIFENTGKLLLIINLWLGLALFYCYFLTFIDYIKEKTEILKEHKRFFIYLLIYSVVISLILTIGRGNEPLATATESRYANYTVLGVISLYVYITAFKDSISSILLIYKKKILITILLFYTISTLCELFYMKNTESFYAEIKSLVKQNRPLTEEELIKFRGRSLKGTANGINLIRKYGLSDIYNK